MNNNNNWIAGAVAQLGERQNRTLEVASSNLVCSIDAKQ